MYHLKKILHQNKQIFLKEVIVDHNLADNIYEICHQYSNNIFLVADQNTEKFLNKSVLSKIPHFIIPSNSIASLDVVELIQNKTKNRELIVAFGSGTVNDICKYASYLEGKDYISFPTAASMNGYTSANASILVNGQKKSFNTHLAKAIYIDINILINSPLRLTLSGFADFICRSTTQADWLLSHLLFSTEYNSLPFAFSHDIEKILLAEYMGLAKKNMETILLLMEALLISGIGMIITGGSHSASQGEHMIAHAMEMVTRDYSSLHGEKVAVATITMANLQEKILSIQNPVVKPSSVNMEHITECFGNLVSSSNEFAKILEQKQIMQQSIDKIIRPLSKPIYGKRRSASEHRRILVEEHSSASTTKLPSKIEFRKRSIHEKWEDISHTIKKIVLPAQSLQKIFAELSIPHLPEHLGWNNEQYYKIVNLAFATRNRFTFLDLANCMKIM